jgi:thiol-disulfide isomerase/thioredoxin
MILTSSGMYVIFILILLLASGIWMYYSYFKPYWYSKYKTNNEYTNIDTTDSKYVEIMLFYTTWCPMCKKAMPEWNQFKSYWENKQIDGYTIMIKEIDCDLNESLADKYKIDGYPTIKMIKDNKIITYDAKPLFSTLNMFLKSEFK